MREAKIEQTLREGVELLGGAYEHKIVPGRRGHPDGEITWPAGHRNAYKVEMLFPKALYQFPRVEFAEVKTETGDFEAGQERDHERRRAMGLEVHVLKGLEQVEAYLRSRGKQ